MSRLVAAVRDVGYDVVEDQKQAKDDEYQVLRRKLAVSLALFVPILIVSMAGLSFQGAQFLQLVLAAPLCFLPAPISTVAPG